MWPASKSISARTFNHIRLALFEACFPTVYAKIST
jgi:hypothetical protein